MSTALKLPSGPTVAGLCLTPRLRAGGAGRSIARRRAAFGVGLLVVAVLAVLVATGRIRVPKLRLSGAGSATAVSARQVPSRAATAEVEIAQAQPPAAPRASEARPASDRVVASTHAAALFAQHSWYVAPPPPPAAAPPPPPEPTAPPFPYTLVGSYAPEGDAPVFFLARGDRVIDAHVGDKLDGVYQLESASGDQLVFVYLPLDIRQNLAAKGAR